MAALSDTFEGPLHIAIIGGTGLESLPSFKPIAQLPLTHPSLQTPWGAPSSPITILSHPREGSTPLNIAFLSRHGLNHEFAPHEVNSRANIAALRKIGVRSIIAFSAVGSLKEDVRPRDFVVPDQVIDRTKGIRPFTFFSQGVVCHVPFADPFDNALRQVVTSALQANQVLEAVPDADKPLTHEKPRLHPEGLVVCMEGPQFSTRAESNLYRSWGASVINMSALPEAKLAREAEISYAMICMSTDYDCWHEEDVSVAMVMANMKANAGNARKVAEVVLDALGKADAEGAEELLKKAAFGSHLKGTTLGGLSGLSAVPETRADVNRRLGWLFDDWKQ